LNVNCLTFVRDDSIAVRLCSLLNVNFLTFVRDDPVAVRLGSLLNVNFLTFVNCDEIDGFLDRGSLTLLDSGLERSLSV